MGAQGIATIDFGAGSDLASLAVTGQTQIASDSLAEAWLFPVATADHSIDEHLVDGPIVIASHVVAGVGFTINALPRNFGNLYGLWSVAWVWN